ncbi:MAG: L,D-transpeptidase family protein [Acidimicrobiales bacterium]
MPGGASGVRSTDGATLSRTVKEHFRIVDASILRLQQLLSILDYSPLAWTPRGATVAPSDAAAQLAALYNPPVGHFSWLNRGWPRQLKALWRRGADNVFTRGLIMSFEADHGLTPHGTLGPSLWNALLVALQANTVNTGGYNFALANKAVPETLTVWHDGKVAITSPANTGIAQSPTVDGTFTVYSRLRSQVMKGTNPNGSSYADLVQYIAYFNGNDAVHYMPRAGYGIPQSLGCVELPYSDAARVWPYLAYGTLVMVIS